MSATTAPVVEPAPAKINLHLHVTGRRADGYHRLDSLAVFVDAGERLRVAAGPAGAGPRLTVDGPFAAAVPTGPDNLVLRAAGALADLAGRPADLALHLSKCLPVASGIGGGSADAAAALRALCRLWNLPAGDAGFRRDLLALAATLGADVPVCLDSRPALMAGIGETLSPAPALPPAALLLVNPGVPVATPDVFRARTGAYSDAPPWPPALADLDALTGALAARGNDLQAPAIGLAPVIGEVLEELAALPGCRLARMSGSGATCFGLFARLEEAWAAAEPLAARHPDWWLSAGAISGGRSSAS